MAVVKGSKLVKFPGERSVLRLKMELRNQPLELLKYGEDWKSFPCVVIGNGRCIRHLYTVLFGPLSRDLCVCHFCDKPTCRNPKHWFIASLAENFIDMMKKGRQNYRNQYMEKEITYGQI